MAGKKYIDAAKLVDASKAYTPKEAVELVKKTSTTKFDASVEAVFRLGIDPKYADALSEAYGAGVEIYPIVCRVSPDAIEVDKIIPFDLKH